MSGEPATVTPPVTPQPVVGDPVPPTTPVAAPATTTPQESQLSENHEVFDKETNQFVKIGELMESHRNKLDPSVQKEAEIIARTRSTDPAVANAAVAEYAQLLAPPPPTPESVSTAHATEIKALQDEMVSLRTQVQSSGEVTSQVRTATELNSVAGMLEGQKEALPFLGQLVTADRMGAAQEVMNQRQLLASQIKQQHQRDLSSFPQEVQMKVLGMAMKAAEQRLSVYATAFGVKTETAPANGPVVVNDQNVQTQNPTHQAARIPTDHTGALILGQPPAVPSTTKEMNAPVPATPVTPSAVGGGPPVVTDAQPQGPLTERSFMDGLKNRVTDMNQQV